MAKHTRHTRVIRVTNTMSTSSPGTPVPRRWQHWPGRPSMPPRSSKFSRRVRRSPDTRLLGADDLEVLIEEDMVRPVDPDVVDVVVTVAQLHDTVDHPSRVGRQRRLG